MSDLIIMAIGGSLFAVTTCATVFAGGLKLSRIIERERQEMPAPERVPAEAGL